jgi:DMSO/TMAO reductase YedYZ molybdopterin-dependent catalytic subunit
VLAAGGLALVGVATVGLTGAIDALRGGTRRFTGSRWLPAGGIPPPTTFFGEGPPGIDAATWRLHVTDAEGVGRSWSLVELQAMGMVERSVVLDCTSGWAMDTTWRGVPLPVVLAQGVVPDRGAGPWIIRSATGWATVLSSDEVADSILAWDVAGTPLPVLNGAPLRLVVPSRRGLDWVKWVSEIHAA